MMAGSKPDGTQFSGEHSRPKEISGFTPFRSWARSAVRKKHNARPQEKFGFGPHVVNGGEGGIRTHEGREAPMVSRD